MTGHSPDAIVVGGGVVGRAAALELLAAGARVTMIYPRDHGRDSATLAAGAMIGAFGELTPDHDGPAERVRLAFRVRSQDAFEPWLAQLHEITGRTVFTKRGMFMIGNGRLGEDADNLRHIRGKLAEHGRRFDEVDPREVPGLSPDVSSPVAEALFLHDDLSVDSADLMAALGAAIAAQPSAAVVDDRVRAIEPASGGAGWIVRGRGGALEAPAVVVCAGARVPAALGEATVARLRMPCLYFAKGIAAVVSGARPIPHAIRTPNRSGACGLHVVPRRDGRLYIGASSHYGYATAAARGVTPGEIAAIVVDAVRQIQNDLRDTTIEEIRFGLRPMTSDDMPLVGRTPLPGLFLGTGTWRTGIVMAPLLGRQIAADVLGRVDGEANPFALGEDRLADGDPDLNVAHLHANRGLSAYYRFKQTGDILEAARAIESLRMYVHLAGEHGDVRLAELADRLERPATFMDAVW